jgi:hypothetical protein
MPPGAVDLKNESLDALAAIVWRAAEAWFCNRELLALQEILDRLRKPKAVGPVGEDAGRNGGDTPG